MRRAMRSGGAAIAGACAVLAWNAGPAVAQELPRIHITALGMHADHNAVAVGDTYHITIHVHIAERRDRLDELQLPELTNAVDRGDERHRVASRTGGTDFYEIMTVSSPQVGTASFSPAYVDAIDPSANRAMRYSSQSLTVRVTDGAGGPEAIDSVTRGVEHTLHDALLYGGIALGAILVPLVIVLRGPRRSPEPAAVATPPPDVAPVPSVDPLRAAIDAFRERGDDASLDALRGTLFTRAGAGAGATLTDALAAIGKRDPALAHAMAIAERVRFGPAVHRSAATEDLLEALDVLLLVGPVRAS